MHWVPNMITLGRLLMVPFLAVMLSNGEYLNAFWLFILVGLSDGLDGYIARKFDAKSAAGAVLDPVADKMVLITCVSILAWNGLLPLWLAGPLILRDVVMLGIGLVDPRLRDGWLPPNIWGKSHAALAFVVLALTMLRPGGFVSGELMIVVPWLLLLATLIVSSGIYYISWRRLRVERAPKGALPS